MFAGQGDTGATVEAADSRPSGGTTTNQTTLRGSESEGFFSKKKGWSLLVDEPINNMIAVGPINKINPGKQCIRICVKRLSIS